MRLIKILFLLIILIPIISSSVNFGISPREINLKSNTNESVCSNFTLYGDENLIFNGNIFWAKKNTYNIEDYNITSENLNINSIYPKNTSAGKYEVCLNGKNSGNYYGALEYKLSNENYGIANWINFNVGKTNKENSLITGNIIGSENKINLKFWILFVLFLILLGFLFYLLKKKKKTKES